MLAVVSSCTRYNKERGTSFNSSTKMSRLTRWNVRKERKNKQKKLQLLFLLNYYYKPIPPYTKSPIEQKHADKNNKKRTVQF